MASRFDFYTSCNAEAPEACFAPDIAYRLSLYISQYGTKV